MTSGFTLVEVMVVIILTILLAVIGVSAMPRPDDRTNGLGDRLASTLESAHTQAVAERTAVTLTGSDERLQVSSVDGTETVSFSPGQLNGSVSIQADGLTSGQLTLQAASTCTRYTLTSYGASAAGSC